MYNVHEAHIYGGPHIDSYSHMVLFPTTLPPVPHLPIGSPLLGDVTTVIIMDKHYSSFPSMYHNACNISISSYEALLEIYSLTGGQRVYPRLSKWVSSLIGKWVGTPE